MPVATKENEQNNTENLVILNAFSQKLPLDHTSVAETHSSVRRLEIVAERSCRRWQPTGFWSIIGNAALLFLNAASPCRVLQYDAIPIGILECNALTIPVRIE